MPYPAAVDTRVHQQNTGRQAAILNVVRQARATLGDSDLDDLLVPLMEQLEQALQLADSSHEGRQDLFRRWDRAWSAVESAKLRISLLLEGQPCAAAQATEGHRIRHRDLPSAGYGTRIPRKGRQ